MPNMNPKRTPMPSLEPTVRAKSFAEVASGYTAALAAEEAQRCLDCQKPLCVQGCPVSIDIPGFIRALRNGDPGSAYNILSASTGLPAVCGRVCPQETQCESRCIRGIKAEPVAIGRLERYVADWHNAQPPAPIQQPTPTKRRVAVVGSGPAGLSCAADLARMGHAVTVFEALHIPGGVLVYGIPEFRLPKQIVAQEIDGLKRLGVTFCTNTVIGKTLTVDDLFAQGFDAVFIGSGAGLPSFMGIPGEGCNGVFSANEYLTRSNLMQAYRADSQTPILRARRVAVVGGGNVAMDAARTALRLGAEQVSILYRRGQDELPARREEVEHAQQEGVAFHFLTAPVEILPYQNPQNPRDPQNGFVRAVRCVRMQLTEPDASGRRRPVAIAGSDFTLDTDAVIIAVGTSPNPLIRSTTDGLAVNQRGGLIIDEATGATSRRGVFAGGDAVTGAATVILAMGAGKTAAAGIDVYLKTL